LKVVFPTLGHSKPPHFLLKFATYSILFCWLSILPAWAQPKLLHQDPEIYEHMREGLHHVYNFEFAEAQPHLIEIKKKYPDHPAYPFSQALILFTKNFPMRPDHADYPQFHYFVQDCMKKADAMLEKDPNHPDAVFFALSANSYLALMSSFSKEYLGAISTARKVYGYIKQGFGLQKTFPDFYYTSGLFYYYAEQYPQTHPIVKPVMIFFENGNKAQGLLDLNIAMLKAIYTKQETYILLSYIYLKYEANPAKSLEYSEKFYFNYPKNPFALSKYIEGLVFNHEYAKAKELLPKLQATHVKFFKMMGDIFAGIIEEKLHKDHEEAKLYYNKALLQCNTLKNKTDDPQSWCHLGLGRIAEMTGNRKKAILCYRKALDIAEYELIKKECLLRLNTEARHIRTKK
jgi:tetratricopeptide (TPR) repeat protein